MKEKKAPRLLSLSLTESRPHSTRYPSLVRNQSKRWNHSGLNARAASLAAAEAAAARRCPSAEAAAAAAARAWPPRVLSSFSSAARLRWCSAAALACAVSERSTSTRTRD